MALRRSPKPGALTAATYLEGRIAQIRAETDDLAIIRLVLDYQNAFTHAASTCRSTITGSVKVNVEPWPG